VLGGKPYPSEGSHCEFGPRSEQEVRLWRFLSRRSDHVSYEKILSGPGLVNLLGFLMEENGIKEPGFEPVPEEITFRALEGKCSLCRQALHMFASILGAEAGNLALKVLAYGGIISAGNTA
jgi:glucokinase